MALIDLIILVALGVFVWTRFFGKNLPFDKDLKQKKQADKSGKKTGKGAGNTAGAGVVVPFFQQEAPKDITPASGVDLLKQTMADFDEKHFLQGAKKAYQYYYEKWNTKDDEALSQLLAPHVLAPLVEELNELDEKNRTPQVEVKRINRAEIVDARLNGRTAIVDVQFEVQQADNMVSEKTGKLVGKEKAPKTVKTVWTFARPVDSEDPNWEVEAIQPIN